MNSDRFTIAGVTLLFDSDIPIIYDKEFLEFKSKKIPDYSVEFWQTSQLQCIDTLPVFETVGYRVFYREKTFIRQFIGTNHIPYAVSETDWEKKRITVQYLQSGLKDISHTGGAFFHIGWEDILLREHRLILHACCIDTSLGGVLFSGPSGIGKSTQGQLWCECEQAKLINGDRPILYKRQRCWVAHGSPYAGSSKCHVNESTDVRAIVMLAQSEECAIRRLSAAEAFRKIYAQMTISAWDSECVKLACDLAEQLVTDVPIYEMSCTPDRNAVELLKRTLGMEVMGGK